MNRLHVVLTYAAVSICLLSATASAQIVPVTVKNAVDGTPIYDIDQPGRIPYQTTINLSNINNPDALFVFAAIPSGHRLVIQQVSSRFGLQSTVSGDTKFYAFVSSAGKHDFYTFTPTPIFAADNPDGGLSQPLQFYVDAGFQPIFELISPGPNFASGSATLIGYLLDCTVAPCAQIAGAESHQLTVAPRAK